MREATRLRPFENDWHLRAYQYFNWADLPDEAAYHARIAVTLDPNQTFLSGWFDNDYMEDTAPPVLPPMPWTPPPEDREIRYFAVLAPVDQRDEMEIAIGGLASFFGGTSTPLPETAAVLRLSFEQLEGDRFLPHMVVEHQRSEPERPQNPRARLFTMFPFEFQPGGPGTPVVEPRFDGATPADIWPLEDGNAAAGSGRYVVDCSQGRGFQYSVLGCLPDVEEAELGGFDWTISVSTERVHVPLGLFDTYRIDVSMTARVVILGVERELPYTASFWVAPELNAWVARIFTVGEEYAHNQAMEIVDPALSASGSE